MRAVCQSIPVGSEGEYQHIRLNDKPEAAKMKPQIVAKIPFQLPTVKFGHFFIRSSSHMAAVLPPHNIIHPPI